MKYEGEGSVNSNGGREAGSARRDFYTVIALLVMVFLVGGVMFAVPAWSQDKSGESEKDGKASKEEKRTQKSETRTQKSTTQSADSPTAKLAGKNPSAREALQAVDQVEASQDLDGEDDVFVDGDEFIELIEIDVNNCDIDPGDSITFEVSGDPEGWDLATVIDGVNANIDVSDDGDLITVEDIDDPGEPIEFFLEDEDDDEFGTEPLDVEDELVVDTSTIDCGNNNNNNNNNRNNRNNRDFFRDRPFFDQYRDQYNDDLEEAEADLEEAEGELSTLESELDDDGEDTSGVSANADENGASAETPGASASAGGDPDAQGPVTGPQGDVVDEVPTSGPLPETGGTSLANSILILGMVLLGTGLLTIRLATIFLRGRRT
jgi:hypothetical protein